MTVAELRARMSAPEGAKWLAFYRVEKSRQPPAS